MDSFHLQSRPFKICCTLSWNGSFKTDALGSSGSRWNVFFGVLRDSDNRLLISIADTNTGSLESQESWLICDMVSRSQRFDFIWRYWRKIQIISIFLIICCNLFSINNLPVEISRHLPVTNNPTLSVNPSGYYWSSS